MVRNKRVIIFSVVFVAISVISALTAKFLPVLIEFLLNSLDEFGMGGAIVLDATVADSYVQYVANFGETVIFLIGILFATTITKEKTKGTYSSLKMNGVKDKDIVLSHLVSQILLVTVSYLISLMVFVLLNICLFNLIMGFRGFIVLSYIYVLMLLTICFTMFISCVCKKRGQAYLFVILTYFVVAFLEVKGSSDVCLTCKCILSPFISFYLL